MKNIIKNKIMKIKITIILVLSIVFSLINWLDYSGPETYIFLKGMLIFTPLITFLFVLIWLVDYALTKIEDFDGEKAGHEFTEMLLKIKKKQNR